MSVNEAFGTGNQVHVSVDSFRGRLEASEGESDVALVYELLIFGELLIKLTTIAAVAAVEDEVDRLRYSLEYNLLRADGIGLWEKALSDVLTGPANAVLRESARPYITEVTRNFSSRDADTSWQRRALQDLSDACDLIDPVLGSLPHRASLRWWFSAFIRLRNRTRGHGALTGGKASAAAPLLLNSLGAVAANLGLINMPWMHLHQNLNSKFRVTRLAGDCSGFDYLKSETGHRHETGAVYVAFDETLCPSPLAAAEAGSRDLLLANGSFKSDGTCEFLDYVTDTRTRLDRTRWQVPPERLPLSETSAVKGLSSVGKSFTNIPARRAGYVSRPELEDQLTQLLTDDRHPVITLVGRGGVGKTSLAIEVLHEVAQMGNFFLIVWLSARDVDLLPQGPKEVRPDILTRDDVALAFADLIDHETARRSSAEAIRAWTTAMAEGYEDERVLFVLDNFETVADPSDLYQYIDHYIRLPNKVLITTRMREFKADYPLEVRGMTRAQFDELIDGLSSSLGIRDLLTPSYIESLYDETEGHPYLTKVLLGEVARTKSATRVERLLGAQDDALRALFERTYRALSPAAQRVFLTLCNWHSMVPVIALEAAILRPSNEKLDVISALDELGRSSLIEQSIAPDGSMFVYVPLSAQIFGQAKLRVSPMKPAVELDSAILQRLGPVGVADVAKGLMPRGLRLLRSIQENRLANRAFDDELRVLTYMASAYAPLWLELANLYLEDPGADGPAAIECVNSYIVQRPEDSAGWRKLVAISKRFGMQDTELHARIQLAEITDSTLDDISDAAAAYARLRGSVDDRDVRRAMEERLIRLFERHLDRMDATDLSRLAWIYVYSGRFDEAALTVTRGLMSEPGNVYLLKLSLLPDVASRLKL